MELSNLLFMIEGEQISLHFTEISVERGPFGINLITWFTSSLSIFTCFSLRIFSGQYIETDGHHIRFDNLLV